MTVTIDDKHIVLSGSCRVDEAERLLAALLDNPALLVVIDSDKVHTALWQVLMAVRPAIRVERADRFFREHLLPLMVENGSTVQASGPMTLPARRQTTGRS